MKGKVRPVIDSLSRTPITIKTKEVVFWEPSQNLWYVRYEEQDED